MLYGRFATSLSAAGSSARRSSAARRRSRARRSGVPPSRSARCGSSARSSSTRGRARPARRGTGQDAEARADLEHDVVFVELGEAPITPRMFSSTRKCWPSSRFGTTGRSREREGGGAFASIRAPELVGVLAAHSPARRRWTTFAGSFGGRARAGARGTGCRSRRGSGRPGPGRPPSARSLAFGYVTLPANET